MEPDELRRKVLFVSETSKILGIAINRIVEEFFRMRGIRDPLADLRVSQLVAVLNISRMEPCSLSDLVRFLHVSKSSASLIVKRLVEKRIVIRETDPENRRQVVISIEPTIRKHLDAVDEAILKWLGRIAEALGGNQLDQWYDVMLKLRTVLDNDSWSNA